ncbi:MAG: hypothetical protein JSR30_00270 [Proteobacteria bacterium]|nr:hypothetical protein [Pseudomonadota bacterium]
MDQIATIDPTQDQVLASLSSAQVALNSCKTAMESKQVADIAEAARVYLERTRASVETVNQATAVRILAEHQMGEFLKSSPRAKGTLKVGPVVIDVDHGTVPATLDEMGITKNESAKAQRLAEIPKREVQQRMEEIQEAGGYLTTNKIIDGPKRAKATTTPKPAAMPLPAIAKEIVDAQIAAKKANSKLSPEGFVTAVLKVLSRHFPNHVGALNERPATSRDVYDAYPRHVGPRAAVTAIEKAMKRQKLSADALLEITLKYAAAVALWPESDREYIPHPATFFNQDRFLDDPKEWVREKGGKPEPRKGRHDLV